MELFKNIIEKMKTNIVLIKIWQIIQVLKLISIELAQERKTISKIGAIKLTQLLKIEYISSNQIKMQWVKIAKFKINQDAIMYTVQLKT